MKEKVLVNRWTGSEDHINQAKQSLLVAREVRLQQRQNIRDQYNLNPNHCAQCENILGYKQRNNKFCCRSCSVTHKNLNRVHTEATKLKLSNKLKVQYETGQRSSKKGTGQIFIKQCVVCHAEFSVNSSNKLKKSCCSIECRKQRYITNGLISATNRVKRSKNEILFTELCAQAGLHIITNQPMFNGWDADIILPDHKIAVMWNGKWHYEKVTEQHSLSQVQNRDKIKINEIIKSGYTPYVIKDMGSYKVKFVQEEFEKFLGWIGEVVSQDFHAVKS